MKFPPEFWDALKQLIIGGVACGIHYLYGVAKNKHKFQIYILFLNVVIGGFVGWLTGEFLLENMGLASDFWVAIAGISAFKIMEFIEERPEELIKFFTKKR